MDEEVQELQAQVCPLQAPQQESQEMLQETALPPFDQKGPEVH